MDDEQRGARVRLYCSGRACSSISGCVFAYPPERFVSTSCWRPRPRCPSRRTCPAQTQGENPSLGPDSSLIVDLSLKSDRGYPPPEKDMRAVAAAGGRVLHAFHVSLLRARLDTATLRRFLGPDSIAEVAYPVRDTTRFDVSVQIFLRHALTPADDSVLRPLGVLGPAPRRRPFDIYATVADSAIPRISALANVVKVQAVNMQCMIVDMRDVIIARPWKP